MTIRKALFGLILACGASVISLAACGDDDDDNGGTSGSGGSAGTAGKSGSAGSAVNGSAGVGGTGGSAPAATCKNKYETCNGDEVCAKLIFCGSVCGALGVPQSEYLTKCQTYANFTSGPQLAQALAVASCAGGTGACADECGGGAGGAGAGGAGAGGAGAGGAGAGGAGAGGAGAGGADAGGAGAGGAGAGGAGGAGAGGGSGGLTCPPSGFLPPAKCTDSGLSACVSCQCTN